MVRRNRAFILLLLSCVTLSASTWINVGKGVHTSPITFVNAGAVTDDGTGNFTLNAPASPQNGDIWVLVISTRSADGGVNGTNLDDWTFVISGSGGGAALLSVAWFRYAGSNPDLVATWGGTSQVCAGIAAFRGCVASGTPFDTQSSAASGTGANIVVTGITPAVSNTMLLFADVSNNDNARATLPTDFTAAFAPGTNNALLATAGADASVALHYKLHGSGATGDLTDVQSAGAAWSASLGALK